MKTSVFGWLACRGRSAQIRAQNAAAQRPTGHSEPAAAYSARPVARAATTERRNTDGAPAPTRAWASAYRTKTSGGRCSKRSVYSSRPWRIACAITT
jgi:hypothetical protein